MLEKHVLPPLVKKMLPNFQARLVLASDELMSLMPGLETSLEKIPKLYAQDGKGNNAIIYAHYFYASSDWYITESDGEEMFGFVILNGDLQMSELGYIPLGELKETGKIELDFHWRPITLGEMKKQKGL